MPYRAEGNHKGLPLQTVISRRGGQPQGIAPTGCPTRYGIGVRLALMF